MGDGEGLVLEVFHDGRKKKRGGGINGDDDEAIL